MSRVKKSRGSKFLALVVALTFLLSMAAPAFASAPADLQQTEAARLQTLGIIAGFPDGSLGLDRTMTRAEFAKVITIATGNEIIADAMVNSPTSFPDAKVGVWYTGYVNVASELGYILGYPDGTFKPNQDITNAEVLTILLRALGYDDRLPGSWPTDYLVKANELGITDGVTFAAKAPALRGDAFIFASRTLDEEMVGWSSDISDFEPKGTTLLAKAFKGTTDEGVLVDLNWDDGTLMATIATVEKDGVEKHYFEVVSTPVISGADGILNLLAKKVSYITNSDDQIIYFSAQDTNVVTDDEITKTNANKANINDKNYDLVDDFEDILFAFPGKVGDIIGATTDNVYAADRVTAVLDGGDIMAVLFEEYQVPGIVDEVDDDYITVLGTAAVDVDLEDAEYAVIKDGNLATLDDLEAGDLIFNVENNGEDVHGLDNLIVAVSKDNAITGTLEKISSDFLKITVEGTEYDVDDDAIASSDGGDSYDDWTKDIAKDFAGEEVTILLSPAGKVAAIISDFEAEAAGLYGILLDASIAGFDHKVKILTAAGDKATFDLDEDEVVAYVYGEKVFDADANVETDNPLAVANDLIKYTLNSKGEIDSITAITDDPDKKAKVENSDKDGKRIKLDSDWYRVSDTTAFFGWGSTKQNDWTTTTWSNFADVRGDVYYDYDGNTVTAIVYNGPVTAKGDYGVILGSGYIKGGPYYELIVLGDRVTYNLASDELNESVVGLVYSFELNADNEITLEDGAITASNLGNVVTEVVYGTVETFRAGDYIKVDVQGSSSEALNNSSTDYTGSRYFYLDDETSIVDVTGDAPAVETSVGRGRTVVLYIDEDGYVDYALIVKEDQLENYGFSAED